MALPASHHPLPARRSAGHHQTLQLRKRHQRLLQQGARARQEDDVSVRGLVRRTDMPRLRLGNQNPRCARANPRARACVCVRKREIAARHSHPSSPDRAPIGRGGSGSVLRLAGVSGGPTSPAFLRPCPADLRNDVVKTTGVS